MISFLTQLWANDQGQDIAEYAVMLAVILVLVGYNTAHRLQRQHRFFASSQFDSVSVTASLKRRQLYSIFTAFLYGM